MKPLRAISPRGWSLAALAVVASVAIAATSCRAADPVRITSFNNRIRVDPGASADLRWTTENATACQLADWRGTSGVPVAQTTPFQSIVQFTTTYQLTCSNASSKAVQYVTTEVNPPVSVKKFVANHPAVPFQTDVTLTWDTDNASDCDIIPGLPNVGPSDSKNVKLTKKTLFQLVCSGKGGPAIATVLVDIAWAPAIVRLTATPNIVTRGSTSRIDWEAAGASACRIEPAGISVATKGSMTPTVDAMTTFTLSCAGPEGTEPAIGKADVLLKP